jgi:RHS repeat-associated protein
MDTTSYVLDIEYDLMGGSLHKSQMLTFGPDITNETVVGGFGFVTTGHVEETDQYFYHSDHLGSSAYITDRQGKVSQFVVYLPFGEALIDSHANPDVMPYKFNGKEKDEETGLYYYGARYYNGDDQVWMGVDPLWEEYPGISPYVYCANNPVNMNDPDGEFPVWAIAGAVLDYGFQVYDNYQKGSVGYDAWIGDVNFVSVGLSAVNPTGKFKVLKTATVEVVKAATENTSLNDGLQINTDVNDVATKATVNTAVDVGVGKLIDAGSTKALQNANKEVSATNKQLKTAERQAQRSPNSTKKAESVNIAKSNLQTARNKEVTTKMLNSTVGQAPNAVQQAVKTTTDRIQKDEEKN